MRAGHFIVLFFLLHYSFAGLSQNGILISPGTQWKYLDNGSNQGTAWRSPGFDDGSWKTGTAELGYGDGDERTIVSYGSSASGKFITTYFRKSFEVSSPSDFSQLKLELLRDDGAVVYLNGQEIFRTNMPATVITYTTTASIYIDGTAEDQFISKLLSPSVLVSGTNTLAVEIHQFSKWSSDISFDLKLSGTLQSAGACGIPSGLNATTISSSMATLSWLPVTGALLYKIQYREKGNPSWWITSSFSSSKVISGLSALRSYEFRVKAVCQKDSGIFSGTTTFLSADSALPFPDLIKAGSEWKFLDNGSNPPSTWKSLSYNDSAWKTGRAELGYGDGDETTKLSYGPSSSYKHITTYFRKIFYVPDVSAYSGFSLNLLRDDGAVIYINGIEVWRNNMPAGTISYLTLASNYIDGSAEDAFISKTIPASAFVNGQNCIAVEIHQNSRTSSDISFNLALKGTLRQSLCLPPTGLTASELQATSAKLSWAGKEEAFSYKIAFRRINDQRWFYHTSKQNSIVLTGLEPATEYFFKVAVACRDMPGDYCKESSFRTLNPCQQRISRFFVSYPGTGSALLNWEMLAGTDRYFLDFSGIPDTLVKGNSILLTGLSAGTAYSVKVRTGCGNSLGEYSETYSFSVPAIFPPAQKIVVDAADVIKELRVPPHGINVNYLEDDPVETSGRFMNALDSLGVKFLRYPGGEKSDGFLWSLPPWEKPQNMLSRPGPFEWPGLDENYAENDFGTLKGSTMDFDEFIFLCRDLNAEPLVVVAYDCMFGPLSPGASRPSREYLLASAEAWVNYSNKVKGYDVKYWMIGNESYSSGSYNGFTTKEQYMADLVEFSKRMKAVDPGIKIIANGNPEWWKTILPIASSSIDFLAVSNYPVNNFTGGYEFYRANDISFSHTIKECLNAIDAYVPASEKDRLQLIVSEFNSADWSGQWPHSNDLGHALVLSHIMMEQLREARVIISFFWNTRWRLNQNSLGFNAIEHDDSITPLGKTISILDRHLFPLVIHADETEKIKALASFDSATSKISVFLLNKDRLPAEVHLFMKNYLPSFSVNAWEWSGSGPYDPDPAWKNKPGISISGDTLKFKASGISLTVLELAPAAASDSMEMKMMAAEIAWSVFPNPCKGEFFISGAAQEDELMDLEIRNLLGQVIFSDRIQSRNGAFLKHIYLPVHASGIYYVLLKGKGRCAIKKVIVQ